ncbi:MAG: hypothetical protein M3Y87_17785 [Myxococcota bacterium]|nr:hypothetical protein [Myxococcota bacterium]
MWSKLVISLGICAVLGVGCGTAEPARQSEALQTAPAPEVAPSEGAIDEPRVDGQIVLDERADGARLIGRIEPVPANADPERAVVLRVLGDGASIASDIDPALDGARILDARFAGNGVVTIGTDHTLRAHAHGRAIELDTNAYGPLSVAGATVAYVRGHAPMLELARADVSSGTTVALTQDMSPVWSPALTPDGRSIVFVSAAEGTPRFYRIDGDGAPRALPPTTRTPGSPIGPRFETDDVEGELLVFDDELGTAWVDLEQGRIVRTTEGAR